MAAYRLFTYLTIAALTFSVAYATDPTQLQDFCVATNDMNNAFPTTASVDDDISQLRRRKPVSTTTSVSSDDDSQLRRQQSVPTTIVSSDDDNQCRRRRQSVSTTPVSNVVSSLISSVSDDNIKDKCSFKRQCK
uniref:Uncharacterized protein n=1 Tax=Chenopodium quinoa TaxID=63459 RepID=A0A803MXD6_CHEQI